jgi:hypothetical protein
MQEILNNYQVRKTNKQKSEFIDYLKNRLYKNGYTDDDIKVEEKWKGVFKTRNIVVGNPDEAKIYVAAHYDTPPISPFPNFMFPTNPVMFLLTQTLLTILIFVSAWLLSVPFAFMPIEPSSYVYIYEAILFGFLFWLMFGYQNKHCANDNTSGTIALVKILEKMPEKYRKDICVVFFDNEEKGLFGSSWFAKEHPNSQKHFLINLDCVGDGENVMLLAKKKAIKDNDFEKLNDAFATTSQEYNVKYKMKKMLPMLFPSDQANFDKGIGMCALNKSIFGMYAGRIHTPFDKICREENLNFIAESVVNYVHKKED